MPYQTSAPSIVDRINSLTSDLARAGCHVPKYHAGKDPATGIQFDSEKAFGKGVKTPEQILGFLQRKAGVAGLKAGTVPGAPAVARASSPGAAEGDAVQAALARAAAESDPIRRGHLFSEVSQLFSSQRKN